MIDTAPLKAHIAALSAKVDEFITTGAAKDAEIADLKAQLAAVVPVDEQPAVDDADADVKAILAKIG